MKLYNDKESRNLIVSDFEHTLFVEAGAGSGKTTSMVSRIMAIILRGLAEIQDIVAITFTNEGAANLKLKIRRELESAKNSKEYHLMEENKITIGDKEKEYLNNALKYLPLAQFSTIHSFCLSILKERPIEAGIDPDFDIESEREISSTFEENWNRFLLENSGKSGILKTIIEENIDLETLKSIASIKCENPNLNFYTETAEDIDRAQLKNVIKFIKDIVKNINAELEVLIADDQTQAGLNRSKSCSAYLDKLENINALDVYKEFLLNVTTPNVGTVKKYALIKETFDKISEQCEAAKKIIYDYQHNIIVRVVNQFESNFKEWKKKTSNLDFDDLLYLTADLLKNNFEVRKYFKKKYKYVFVDETQDTDPLQTETMFFICEKYDQNSREWSNVKLDSSKLFMVGDPKQSIYKFRKADVQIYAKTKDIIESQGGKILTLSRNFRSHKNIINFVNNHFSKSFNNFLDEQKVGLQAEYIPLEFSSENTAEFSDYLYAIGAAGKNNDLVLGEEISRIVAIIQQIVDSEDYKIYDQEVDEYRKIKYSDVMILLRGLTYIDSYRSIFEYNNIPHQVVGGKTFFNSEDVRGLVYALKVIDDPTDNLALYFALRSSAFGLSDKALLEYVSTHNRLSFYEKIEEENTIAESIISALGKLYKTKKFNRPSEILKEIYELNGICHLSLLEPNGQQKSSKYYRFLELVLEIEEDQSLSFSSVVKKLEDVMNSEDPGITNISLSQGGADVVKLITIHKAKGLEAPVIILAGSNFSESESIPSHFVLRDSEEIIIPYHNGGFYSLSQNDLENLELIKAKCEDERLRYVAATRAKDLFVICTSPKGTFNGNFTNSIKDFSEVLVDEVPKEDRELVRQNELDMGKLFKETVSDQNKRKSEFNNLVSEINSKPLISSVHSVMDYDQSVFSQNGRSRRGQAFGRLIHKMLQYYIDGIFDDPESIIDEWMIREDVKRGYKKDALKMFNNFIKMDSVTEARNAAEKYCEWEFFYKEENRLINGVIDLIYKDAKGNWILIDFKTDDVSDPEYKIQVDEIYQKQLELYKKYFEKITGHIISKTIILYSNN